MREPKPIDDIDWDEAVKLFVESFPGLSPAEMHAIALKAAEASRKMGKAREAEVMARTAEEIRARHAS